MGAAWMMRLTRDRLALAAVRHRRQEVLIRLRLRHPREQQLHRLDRRQGREHLSEHPYAAEVFLRDQQFFFPRPALQNVDRREYATICQLPVQVDLEVARALELLEDYLVHARAGIDERGGDDR